MPSIQLLDRELTAIERRKLIISFWRSWHVMWRSALIKGVIHESMPPLQPHPTYVPDYAPIYAHKDRRVDTFEQRLTTLQQEMRDSFSPFLPFFHDNMVPAGIAYPPSMQTQL